MKKLALLIILLCFGILIPPSMGFELTVEDRAYLNDSLATRMAYTELVDDVQESLRSTNIDLEHFTIADFHKVEADESFIAFVERVVELESYGLEVEDRLSKYNVSPELQGLKWADMDLFLTGRSIKGHLTGFEFKDAKRKLDSVKNYAATSERLWQDAMVGKPTLPEYLLTPTPSPISTTDTPGFEIVFAFACLSAVAYLLRRRGEKIRM